MAKIGRNSPCFCGSGKKYKKCCLNKKSKNTTDPYMQQLDDMMQKGYKNIQEGKAAVGCALWLEIWESLKGQFSPQMKSIKDAESVFSGTECLFNWCQDLEMELEKAGRQVPLFFEKRIKYCREFYTLFPKSASLVIQNMKRAEAESYFAIGNIEKGEEAFKAIIEEFPDSIYGYMGWGDMYVYKLTDKISSDFEKAEKIYQRALDKNIKGKEIILERLEDLKKEKEGQC